MPEADPEKLLKMAEAELAAQRVRGGSRTAVDRTNFRIWSLAAIVIGAIAAVVFLQVMVSSMRPVREDESGVVREEQTAKP